MTFSLRAYPKNPLGSGSQQKSAGVAVVPDDECEILEGREGRMDD
jgi:hypothetical protein